MSRDMLFIGKIGQYAGKLLSTIMLTAMVAVSLSYGQEELSQADKERIVREAKRTKIYTTWPKEIQQLITPETVGRVGVSHQMRTVTSDYNESGWRWAEIVSL